MGNRSSTNRKKNIEQKPTKVVQKTKTPSPVLIANPKAKRSLQKRVRPRGRSKSSEKKSLQSPDKPPTQLPQPTIVSAEITTGGAERNKTQPPEMRTQLSTSSSNLMDPSPTKSTKEQAISSPNVENQPKEKASVRSVRAKKPLEEVEQTDFVRTKAKVQPAVSKNRRKLNRHTKRKTPNAQADDDPQLYTAEDDLESPSQKSDSASTPPYGFNGIESLSVDYLLSDQENTFAVLVVPTGDSSNWTFCLFYDTYTEFDPAFPGILPIECDVKNNPFDAFTVISVNYTNRTANLSIYTAKIDVWYELAKNVSLSPEDAMVFDFKKSSGRGFVSLRDYSSKFKIPEFLKINNTVMLSTNGNGIRQITPSLSRIPTVQTTTTELPTPTELSTTEFPLIKTSTTEISIRNISVPAKNFSFESTTEFELPTTTTPSSFVQQLIEESQAILPSLKRSALFSSSTARLSTTFSSTASSSTTTASSTIFSTLLTPTTKQTSARKPKTTSIRAVRKNSPDHQLRTTPKPAVYTKPSTAAFDILHSNNTSSQSTSEFDVRAAISTQRSTAKEKFGTNS
ncbi:hypothetical protein M3Y96_01061300 [Aphelenchoides besseyi]|nr:hypothetical protein M3Y96_01061300 [Aphelenchoides besseyi]